MEHKKTLNFGICVCLIALIWIGIPIVSAVTEVYSDNFDTYSVGITPPGWVERHPGASHTIDSSQSFSSPNSFRLIGHQSGNCVMSNPITGIQPDSELWFESYVLTTDLAYNNNIGFSTGSDNPVFGSVSFAQTSAGHVISSGGASKAFTPNTWYKVTGYLNLKTRTFTAWINDEILTENSPIEALSGVPEQLTISSGNHFEGETVWYDNVKIGFGTPGHGTPTPEFPSPVLAATMIVGVLGAVLLIQRTKEN